MSDDDLLAYALGSQASSIDPLDAFMNELENQPKEDNNNKSGTTQKTQKRERGDIDDMDDQEIFMKHLGKTRKIQEKRDEEDRRKEQPQSEDGSENEDGQTGNRRDEMKKEIEPLKLIDHDKIAYLAIEKNFYTEHEDVQGLSEDALQKVRKDLDIRVYGSQIPRPAISFVHFGFGDLLMEAIRKNNYITPTGIQQQAIPVALSGRDLVAVAKTGSGKTAAFVLPLLIHLLDQPELEERDGPIALILAPTRELAVQIFTEAKKFAKCYGVKVSVIYGGANKSEQFKELRGHNTGGKGRGPDVLVATPGRLIDMIKIKATNLHRVSYLVLDEADKMFDLGFEPQVQSICNNIRPDRQTLLFSATFPQRVEQLALRALDDPIKIVIGNAGEANSDITQSIVIVQSDEFKFSWLTANLLPLVLNGQVLIFVSRKEGVDALVANLQSSEYKVGGMHGDMSQGERDRVIRGYKKGDIKILIATDIAARGLDIKNIRTVINYDVARDVESHVHRIGRTGRAGEKGTAYTLITMKEDRFAGDLLRNLEYSGQPVPPELLQLAMKNPRFRGRREYLAGRGGRGRGGRGTSRGGRGAFRAGLGF